jgi:hypothetical protein
VKVESLEELVAAFSEWRSKKRHPREATPVDLVERVGRVAKVHGLGPVMRAVKLDRRVLKAPRAGRARRGPSASPSYSRVELVAPPAAARPFAELEMPSGVRVRLYSQTPEAMGLLSSVCGAGGGR